MRVLLRRHDVYTLFVDEHGVESEKSLNALLDMTETEEIFGAGMVMEMNGMLVVQGGPNLRNVVAHGLLDDNSAWSYSALYMWWFCLRLVTWPVIEMVARARTQAAESSGSSMATGGADTEPAAQTTADIEAGALAEDRRPEE